MIDIDQVKLTAGNHASIEAGACVMELSSHLAHEPWSDRPACVSGVIGAFLRTWNDQLDDAGRQKLKPYAARVIGTKASKAVESRRAWLATDWMCRTYLPAWLDLGGMPDQAAAVRALPPITKASIGAAQPVLSEARKRSAAARAAAGAAAWAAARDAAWDAARDAAWDAAWDAAGSKLAPTVASLQASAFELLDLMIAEKYHE